MKKFIVAVMFTIVSLASIADPGGNGKVTGKIVDKKSGEELIGVSVQVQGTNLGSVTDFEGKYMISLPAGKYTLVFNYVSYGKKVVEGVEVKAGDVTYINISLEEATKELNEVVIKGEVKKETASGLLIQQKSAASISDGISAESIRKTPDRNTGDVLKRVSGASIQDNRFAIIRGLNERYTTAYINGAPLPSSESDRKAFSFDIFPANLLDNLVITKTATPDMPGEFGGGVIEINTKSIPDNNFQSISLSGGYNSITTFKDQITYKGGKTDWLGIDDGTRALPSQIPSDKDFPVSIKAQAELGKAMPNDWALQQTKFSPNYGFQYSIGRVWGQKKSQFGTLFAVTYNKSSKYTERKRNAYDSNYDPNIPVVLTSTYDDQIYADETLTGILGNISYKINPNHQITFKNLFSINSEDRVTIRNGTPTPLDANPILIRSNERYFSSNKIYSGQLAGSDYLASAKIKINWNIGLSDVNREIPNIRRNSYARNKFIINPDDPDRTPEQKAMDTVYKANVAQSNVGPDYAGNMFYSSTHEKIYSFKADASRAFDIKSLRLKNNIKIGGLTQNRHRDFAARQLGYIKYAPPGSLQFPDSILYLPDDQLFSQQYMGQSSNGYGGFALSNKYKPTDTYNATSRLNAAFLMFDHKFKERLRLIWGVRMESYTQIFNTTLDDKTPYSQTVSKVDFLPSANLIITLNENQNVRLGYSETVNRPEFRELAPFAFYDYQTRFVVSGKPTLERALLHNYDVRYEWYPGRGQLISVSGFYKQFDNPIEQVMRVDVSEEITYNNLKSAKVYGAEFEFRLLIGSLFKLNPKNILNDITVFSNLALIKSSVDLTRNAKDTGLVIKDRPLQGQSPYIINSGIQYFNVENGWSFSASYNKIGQRIYIVGSANEPDIWEQGRDMIDLQLAKTFFKNKLEVRLNVQNLLAQKQYFFQDHNHNQKFDKSEDQTIWVVTYGQVYSMNITYKF